jgi:ubiquinone/menaquinone biosynthesis C-methylase UbiE
MASAEENRRANFKWTYPGRSAPSLRTWNRDALEIRPAIWHARGMALDSVQRAAQEQFARQSQRYGSSHILADVRDVEAAVQRMDLPRQARVLDVATGAGHTGLYLASLGHRVILADLAAPMLERVREAAMQRGLDVEVNQHPAEELPYPDRSFDLVTCRVAAHHFSSPADFIRESARVLQPQGWFLLIDGSVPDDESETEEWLHRVEKLRDPSHHRLLSPRAWSGLCALAGLRVLSAELFPFKQPDLEWYFETAATSSANRTAVRELIVTASPTVRRVLKLTEEETKIVWWWSRLTLIARKGG